MKRISTPTRVLNKFGAGKDGFTDGDVIGGIPSTDLEAALFDNLQEEIANVVETAGLTLNGADQTQLLKGIKLVATGRRLRTTRYTRVAGVQNISVDGGTNTTSGAGTFTRHADTKFAIFKVQGGGSGGNGSNAPAGGLVSLGSPGCSGSYAESIFDAATIGASPITITVGLGSAGSTATVGGTSTVGVLMSAPGGTAAGSLASQTPPTSTGNGVPAGSPTGANLVSIVGMSPQLALALSTSVAIGGAGGASQFGAGGNSPPINTNGTSAINPGSGGSGTVVNSGGGTATGGNGAAGIIIVEEYA